MKMPLGGISLLRAKAWKKSHDRLEVVAVGWKDVFFGFFAKQPIFFRHVAEIETIRFDDRNAREQRVSCSCGEMAVFK